MTMRTGGEARPVLNIEVQTEINRKENRIYVVKERPYRPNLKVQALTGKFYAKHDFPDPDLLDPALLEALERIRVAVPKNKSPDPQTTNQEYGWYNDPLVEPNRQFHYPKIGSWITQIGAVISKEQEKNPKKPFTGIPFKL